jgi:hypothetical protein
MSLTLAREVQWMFIGKLLISALSPYSPPSANLFHGSEDRKGIEGHKDEDWADLKCLATAKPGFLRRIQ